MSFYWAAGGMIGVKSVGGKIYQLALERNSDFLIVWVTGAIKVAGGVVLLLLLSKKNASFCYENFVLSIISCRDRHAFVWRSQFHHHWDGKMGITGYERTKSVFDRLALLFLGAVLDGRRNSFYSFQQDHQEAIIHPVRIF
jgi:hypothetical protein